MDLISRQAAIDALAEQIMESALMDNPTTASTDINSYRPIAELSLRDVPSAQPEFMKSSDLIRRQEAIEICNDAVNFWDGTSGVTGILSVRDEIAKLDSVQPEHTETHSCDYKRTETHDDAQPRWIPFETREPDAEEKQEHPEWDFVLCGKLPQDGQRILVNIKYKGHEAVQMDEYNDDGRECYLHSGYDIATEATAWMPLPEPYKEEQDD